MVYTLVSLQNIDRGFRQIGRGIDMSGRTTKSKSSAPKNPLERPEPFPHGVSLSLSLPLDEQIDCKRLSLSRRVSSVNCDAKERVTQ
jgi:hypothetical protein